jgi:hypothetical protein
MPKKVSKEDKKRPQSFSLPAPEIFLVKEIEQMCLDTGRSQVNEHIIALHGIAKRLGIDTQSEDYKQRYAEWLEQKGWSNE